MAQNLHSRGNAALTKILTVGECQGVAALYESVDAFRSRVVMERVGFGRGEYQYFKYPLPPIVDVLRELLYARLVPVANQWNETMGIDIRYPQNLHQFLERCHAAAQARPTP